MEPNSRYPFNVRSFFTNQEVKNIGGGIELWRGYFQSIRPGMGRMLLNIDISTGMMYKSGPLIGLALDFFGRNDPGILSPASGLPDRERLRLQRFLAGVRVTTPHTNGTRPAHARVVKKLSTAGADSTSFTISSTNQISTVAQYFHNLFNRPLRYPKLLCVEVSPCYMRPRSFRKSFLPKAGIRSISTFRTLRGSRRPDHEETAPVRQNQRHGRIRYEEAPGAIQQYPRRARCKYCQVSSMMPGAQSFLDPCLRSI